MKSQLLNNRDVFRSFCGMLLFVMFAFTYGCSRPQAASINVSREGKIARADIGPIVKELRLSAPIKNDDSVDIFSGVEGTVSEIYVEAGQMVKVGDPVLKIDDLEAKAELRKAALKLEDAKCDLSLETSASADPIKRRKKEISIELAEAEYTKAERAITKHIVRVSKSGKIEKIGASVGDYVGAKGAFNQGTTIASIVGDKIFKIQITVNERAVPMIRLKQSAKVIIDAIPGLEADGNVVDVQANAEPSMGAPSFPVTVRFRTMSSEVKLGMTGSVVLRLAENKSCLRIPIQAVRLANDRPYVIIVNTDGTERNCDIKLGIDDGDNVEIAGAIQNGDQVLLLGV